MKKIKLIYGVKPKIEILTIGLSLFFSLSLAGCITYYNTPVLSLREKYVNLNRNLLQEIKQAVIEGRAIEGMTTKDVLAAWGKPNSIKHYDDGDSWFYDRPSLSFAPKKTVGFDKTGIVIHVSEFHWYEP